MWCTWRFFFLFLSAGRNRTPSVSWLFCSFPRLPRGWRPRCCRALFQMSQKWSAVVVRGLACSLSCSGYCCCSLVAKPCPTLCHPMDYSPPGSFVRGLVQAGRLQWFAVSSSGDWTHASCTGERFFTAEPPGQPCPGCVLSRRAARLTSWAPLCAPAGLPRRRGPRGVPVSAPLPSREGGLASGGLRLLVGCTTKAHCTCWERLDLISEKNYVRMIETRTAQKDINEKGGRWKNTSFSLVTRPSWSALWMFLGEVI